MKLPQEFEDKMKNLLGEEWDDFLSCYEKDRFQALRLNPLKKGWGQKSDVLEKIGIGNPQMVPWAKEGYYYRQSDEEPICQPGKHPYHEMGLYYIQEPSAMSAAALLAPRPGERVLDLCAAPGGKTTQLASYMKQEGILVANEIYPARAKILAQNIERMGIANAIVTNEDSDTLKEHFGGYFHRILVDAPCSGEGMFRKNEEALEEWSIENVSVCAKRQEEILENANHMLISGGSMVYSTCTFSPEENEQIIGNFLERHPEYTVVEPCGDDLDRRGFSEGNPMWGNGNPQLKKTYRLWPHKLHGEGHFAALLQKGSPVDFSESSKGVRKRKKSKGIVLDIQTKQVLETFLKEEINVGLMEYILEGELKLFGDQLYRMPENTPDLRGLHILRAGLHIGTFKKNRFEPSHALALFAGKDEVKKWIHLSLPKDETAVKAFLRGETLSHPGEKGWNLICVDGFSAGWGKSAGGVVKNHYPKGLRWNG